MGNGEQYIWKPPEEDDIITLHPPPLCGENGQGHPSPPTAKEVVYKCVYVCVVVVVSRRNWNLQADGKTDRSLIIVCYVYRLGRPFDWTCRHNCAVTRFLLTARGSYMEPAPPTPCLNSDSILPSLNTSFCPQHTTNQMDLDISIQ